MKRCVRFFHLFAERKIIAIVKKTIAYEQTKKLKKNVSRNQTNNGFILSKNEFIVKYLFKIKNNVFKTVEFLMNVTTLKRP